VKGGALHPDPPGSSRWWPGLVSGWWFPSGGPGSLTVCQVFPRGNLQMCARRIRSDSVVVEGLGEGRSAVRFSAPGWGGRWHGGPWRPVGCRHGPGP
jgi:hypothetical protein